MAGTATIASSVAVSSESRPAACPVIATADRQPAPKSLADASTAVLTLLNSGDTVQDITSALTAWGMTSAPTSSSEPGTPVTSVKVLPGNDTQLAVVFYDPTEKDQTARLGDVLVFSCANGQYVLTYRAADDPTFGGQVSNPRITAVRDATGDGVADLMFVSGECSPATCVESITVLAHVGSTPSLTNISTNINGGPEPTFNFVPSGRDASQSLVIAYGTLNDVDAGPQRAFTETWMLADGAYTLTASVNAPAVFRVHALQDADDAFRRKAYPEAVALYGRVINDTTLQAWDGPGALADEQGVLSAFSRFRLAELAAAQGNAAGADAALKDLQTTVKAGSLAEVYLKMATEFANQLKDSGDYTQACNSIIVFAERNESAYRQLGGDVFGFANYDYQPDDMCIKK